MRKLISNIKFVVLLAVIAFSAFDVYTQGTAFNYQGALTDSAQPANGTYDLEFLLFDQASGGSQVGATVTANGIIVTNGAFSVTLDFGDQFPGADRWIEIRVRQASAHSGSEDLGGFTILAPRQPVKSVPYAQRSSSAGAADTAATADFATSADAANTATTATSAASASTADTATNALNLGGVAAGQYVVTTDPRLSDARTPTAGSGDYIQNGTTQQSSSNFNISGTGTSGVFNATDRFDLGGTRALGISNTTNLFVGVEAGQTGPSGTQNTLIGYRSGASLEGASNNVFVGAYAGENSVGFPNNLGTPAGLNTFVGSRAGRSNVDGTENTYIGAFAGNFSLMSGNTFIGYSAGESASGGNNIFIGRGTGIFHDGNFNTFIGNFAGNGPETGTYLTLVGLGTDLGEENLSNASAIGAFARVDQDNSLVLGSIAGINNATENTRVGIGTSTPERILHVKGPGAQEIMVESSDASGRKWTIQASGDPGSGRFEIVDRTAVASRVAILANGRVGIGVTSPQNRFEVNGAIQVTGGRVTPVGNAVTISSESDYDLVQSWANRNLILNGLGNFVGINNTSPADQLDVSGRIRVSSLGSAGATTLCRNTSNQISTCSSSIRYKNDVKSFPDGFNKLRLLRPVTFSWKDSSMFDLGLVAEEVAEIEPLLVTYKNGEVEGVKYDRIGVLLVNVVKEQATELERQKEKVERQKAQIDTQEKRIGELEAEMAALKAIVCSGLPDAAACKGRD